MATPTLPQALANQLIDPLRQSYDPQNNILYNLDPGTVAAFIAANPYTPGAGLIASELAGVPDALPITDYIPPDSTADTGSEHY